MDHFGRLHHVVVRDGREQVVRDVRICDIVEHSIEEAVVTVHGEKANSRLVACALPARLDMSCAERRMADGVVSFFFFGSSIFFCFLFFF